jgi:hypothetical protein
MLSTPSSNCQGLCRPGVIDEDPMALRTPSLPSDRVAANTE